MRGRICDRAVGEWVTDASVQVEDNPRLETTTDADGVFELVDVPPGEYVLVVYGSEYTGVRSGVVIAGEMTDIGVTECRAVTGNIDGRVCDDDNEVWLAGGDVSLTSNAGAHTTTTDANGRFTLADVPIGDHTIAVSLGSFSTNIPVTVAPYDTVTVGDAGCGPVGGLRGRICGSSGHWLSGADVWIDLGGGDQTATSTDGNGFFTLSDVPAGDHTVQVQRGSFYTSFEVTVEGGQTNTLAEPVCIPPTTRMAVVTGVYDSIEDVLGNLGNPIGQRFTTTTPTVEDPDGNVDIINGSSDFWMSEFLADSVWMSEYDIILFNCGLSDWELENGDTMVDQALANLVQFVSQGGSVYASDWASEIVRMAFPGRVNFYGDDNMYGEARKGASDSALSAQITDGGLAAALGRTDVTLNLDLGSWVIMEPLANQSPLDVLVRAEAVETSDWLAPTNDVVNDVPLMVQFDHGQGRVLYTSFHNESQTTEDLDDILRYAVFEL